MTIRATWHGAVLAESENTIMVEGNHYFPPQDVHTESFRPSDSSTHCPWKGDASYLDVVVDGTENTDAAWFYPHPYEAALDIADYVAFWHGVEVTGTNPGEAEIRRPQRASA